MNWKKWVGLVLVLLSGCFRHAFADSYQLAISSWVVNVVTVSSNSWTQVDAPLLAGRTSVSVYNVDGSSPIYCQSSSSTFLPSTVPGVFFSTNTTQVSAVPIAPQAFLATSSSIPSVLTLSLSNFATNRGAYPVSVSMPVWCATAKQNATSIVEVMQSY